MTAPTPKKPPRTGRATVKEVEAMRAPGRHSVGDCLMLVVSPKGARSWLARVRDPDGKRRDIGLGSYPAVSLAEARERVGALLKQSRDQLDPVREKKRARLEAKAMPTFREAARIAHDERKGGWRNAKHKAQWLSSLEAYAFPHLGEQPVDKITAPMIRDVLLPIWLDKPATASRVRQRIGTVLDWAHAKGYRDQEAPTRSIGKGLPRQPNKDRHFAALPYERAPGMLAKLAEGDSIGRLALRFLILTAARSGEVRGARWDEIDREAKVWTVPAERMKAGKPHLVPLSDAAIAVLDRAPRLEGQPLIFPGLRGRPMSDMTLARALRVAGGGKATVHGFRSSFRDWAAEQTATPGDVVEAALAHTIPNRVEAAYRRTNYLEKRRGLMAAWANYLAGRPADVIPLHGAAHAA